MLLGVSLDLKYFVNQDFKGVSLQNDRTATKALRIFLQATFPCFMYKEIHIVLYRELCNFLTTQFT